jgi:hypothetical protein
MKEVCEKLLSYIIDKENFILNTNFKKFNEWRFTSIENSSSIHYHRSMIILIKNVMFYKNIENNVIEDLVKSNDHPNIIIAVNLLYGLLNEK